MIKVRKRNTLDNGPSILSCYIFVMKQKETSMSKFEIMLRLQFFKNLNNFFKIYVSKQNKEAH